MSAVTGCGSDGNESASGSGGGSCELPDTVKVAVVKDKTGPNSGVGVPTINGIEVALEQVEKEGLLGDTKIQLDVKDTANSAQTAASHVTAAAADSSVVAVLGPPISEQALAVAPIANDRQIPIIFNQAGSEGVVTGDWTFRVTPPLPSYYDQVVEPLKAKGVKSIGIIAANDNPTLIQLGEVLSKAAEDNGIEVTSSTSVPQTLQDFTGPVSTLMEKKPDAVGALMYGTNFAGLRTALSQAGFDGTVAGYAGVINSIEPVAKAATGTIWPTNFIASAVSGVGEQFVTDYQAKFGELPGNYAAEGYDSLLWLAKALEAEKCADRDGIRRGLVKVAEAGFEGAQGRLTFEDDGRDARAEVAMVEWDGSAVVPLQD